MADIQQDFISIDLEAKGQKLELLQARVKPEFKKAVHSHCKNILEIPYSVAERLIWRRILNNYQTMPNLQREPMKEVESAVNEVLIYLPVIKQQRKFAPRDF